MKQKKGFTLIELLAVIVILAVIALIATPLIMGVINDAKKGAFSDSMHGIVKAAELYTSRLLTKNPTNIFRTVHFDGTTNDLNLSGEQPKNGILVINKNGEIQFTIPSNNQKWCAKKSYETDKITISDYVGSDCTSYHTVKDYSNKKMDGHNYGVKIENGEAHFGGTSYMSAGYANYNFKNQITLGARFYYPGDNDANYIVGNWEASSGGIVSYSTTGSDRIQLELYVNGAYQLIKIPGLTKNQYHTVIMTYNGSKMDGYVMEFLLDQLHLLVILKYLLCQLP